MGFVDKLGRLEKAAKGEWPLVRCTECGEEARLRSDPQFELVSLRWRMHQLGVSEPPPDTPPDVLWLYHHPCDGLALVNVRTGAPALGTRFAAMVRARKYLEDQDDEE